MTPEQVKEYWTQQATVYGDSYEASWTDKHAMELENNAIKNELYGMDILDVGCANGFKIMSLAKSGVFRFVAIDYIPEMIEKAKQRYETMKEDLISDIDFRVGNILALEFPDNYFDTVMGTRVLINLDGQEQQRKAMIECARVLKPGGRLIISEATTGGWRNLNLLRSWFGLSEIPIPSFNKYINEEELCSACKDLLLHDVINFSSTYFIGTRVVKPLLIERLGIKDSPANPNSEINKLFSELPSWGDYGTQKMFVFEKVVL